MVHWQERLNKSCVMHPQQLACGKASPHPSKHLTAAAVAALPAAVPRLSRQRPSILLNASGCDHEYSAVSKDVYGDPLAALREWVAEAGGYIDPRLTVSDRAPVSGCRGIVASAPISLADLESVGPLISVPQQLQFTSRTALDIISKAAGPAAAAAAADQLSDTRIIAAALAHELHNASSSYWQPYLESLPPRPPNPWLQTDPDQVLAAVEPYKQHLTAAAAAAGAVDWVAATAAARQQQLSAAKAVEALLGKDLGISQNDVMSALGQVTPRSLVSGSSSGMCPVIDLVNHHAAASAPMLQLNDSDMMVMTVLPLREGEAVPMAAGDELLILYKGGYTPLEAFLKFGFVAEEWWHQQ